MGRIAVLSDALINRIAAGEVVERPASVVKELVENALDAGARSIIVRVEGGGRRRVVVDDDGSGMDRDDALLCLERHATSKLSRVDDLIGLATMGFRGEALASIAAVSRFLLRTAAVDGEGTEIEVHGGRIREVRQVPHPQGTTVEVARLFHNVPARRKFLRSEATELSHVARLVTRFALAFPGLRFRLEHGGRVLLQTDPAEDLAGRVSQIYGRDFAAKLLPVDAVGGEVHLHGLTGRPMDALPRRDGQHLFVNRRSVHDRMLLHAVAEAYGNTVPRGRYPSVFLFVDVEPGAVDVNVHPQKTEVRFRQSSLVHDATRDALRGALSHVAVVPELEAPGGLPEGARSGVARAVVSYVQRHGDAVAESRSGWGEPLPASRGDRPDAELFLARPSSQVEAARPARAALPLAQYRESYILAQDAQGLLLVDQHAAHERVLFEQYLAEAEANQVEVQQLLFPLTFELPPDQLLILEQEAEEFRRLGFRVEPFGGGTVRVDAIPAVTAEVDPETLVRELLGEAGRTRAAAAGATGLRHKLVTSAACQAAIKINHPLAMPSMQRLLDDLFETDSPSTCPHGRPLIFRMSHEEIERVFRRR